MAISTENKPIRDFAWRDADYYGNTIIYGKNEVKSEAENTFAKFGYQTVFRRHQFENYTCPNYDFVKATHAWLDENIQSPWYLNYMPCYHPLSLEYMGMNVCVVHIERYDERDAFEQSEYGKTFGRASDCKTKESSFVSSVFCNELHELAVLKGLNQPFSTKESFSVWDAENSRVFMIGCKNGQQTMELYSQHPEVVKLFEENILQMGLFTLNDQGVYTCPTDLFKQNKLNEWANSVRPAKVEYGGTSAEPSPRITIRYDDTRADLMEYWGHLFVHNKEKDRYDMAGAWKKLHPKERELHPGFLPYMHGHGSDPSLKVA